MTQAINPAKRFLRGYKALVMRRQSLIREIDRLHESLTGTTVQLKQDVVTGSGAKDRIGDIVPSIVDAEEALRPALEEINNKIKSIMAAIDAVPDEMEKTVLTLRYVECLDWIKISELIHYEERMTFVLHGRGLVAVNKWLTQQTLQ